MTKTLLFSKTTRKDHAIIRLPDVVTPESQKT